MPKDERKQSKDSLEQRLRNHRLGRPMAEKDRCPRRVADDVCRSYGIELQEGPERLRAGSSRSWWPSAALLEPGDDGGPEAKQKDHRDHGHDNDPAAPGDMVEKQALIGS
jgi:hypothetical protein